MFVGKIYHILLTLHRKDIRFFSLHNTLFTGKIMPCGIYLAKGVSYDSGQVVVSMCGDA